MTYRAVDLFCGCGGLSTGLDAAGFEVVAGLDSWADALTVYRMNHESDSHAVLQHDLSDEESTIDIVRGFKPDLIAGGPPCQDFSSAGTRKEGDRADLTVKYANVVTTVRPRAFIMENVSRAQHAAAFANAKQIFSEAGYGLTQIVLNASYCGVPQARKRLFLIGVLGASDGFLDKAMVDGQTKKAMSMREYFGEEMPFDHYYRHPRTYERRAIYSMDEPSPTIRGVNRPMPPGYKQHANDAHVPDETVKALTLEQRARIQTFPAGYFDTKLSKASKEQMVGNAVPVELARYVAEKLMNHIVANSVADADVMDQETAKAA